MPPLARHLYEFGPFRLYTSDRTLLRDGHFVALTPKVFETLVVLVEHSGRILEKEDLLHLIWPDSFVEEVSLAKNVSILRKVLGEDEAHRYIDTIPRRGYRFVAQTRDLGPEGESPSTVFDTGPPHNGPAPEQSEVVLPREDGSLPAAAPNPRRLPVANHFAWPAVLVALIAAGLIFALVVFRRPSNLRAPLLKSTPLTSYPGHESQVAFSPDGNQIAFAWDERQTGRSHIYVKLIGAETPLRLTNSEADDTKPAWSPDGRSIVFVRTSTQGIAYYVIPALGGAERKLVDVFPYLDLGVGNSPYYSPNGKYVAIIDRESPTGPSSIFLLSMVNLDNRKLTSPPASATGDYYPAFSPDGKMLAFARATSFSTTDLYILQLPGGEPRRLTFDSLTIQGLAWTPDSREIIFSSRRGGSISYLWRVRAAGGKPERISTVGKDVLSPAVSSRGNRLAYAQAMDDMNVWRIVLDASGQGKPEAAVIASTYWDADPDYSPDGREIVFTSGRSGGFGIWLCEADGTKPRLLFDGGPYLTGTPRWSPDGRWVAFDSRSNDSRTGANPDIYVISADGGHLRRLTTDPAEDVAPSWSHDGRWVYFGSMRSGAIQVWKVPAEGGAAIQVTRRGGFEAFERSDGKYLYYLKGRGIPGIWRVLTAGGEEVLVTDRNQAGLWRYWCVTDRGIFYATATAPAGPRIEFFDLATGQVREITPVSKEPDINVPGLAISPDGRYLLYVQKDQSGSDIMMIEDFQ